MNMKKILACLMALMLMMSGAMADIIVHPHHAHTRQDTTAYLHCDDYTNEEKCFLEMTNKRYIGLPALEGLRLTKVECTHGSVDHPNRHVSIVSDANKTSTESQATVSGGEVQLFTTQGEIYTYELSGTAANTVYYILCSKTGVGISSITLTYEP